MNQHSKLIAFYLPQFHTIPENDEWWGKGFTDWTNVKKATPRFKGHYQPHVPSDLGYYNLLDPNVRQNQVDLAREHGIHGFCYYHYWFNGKRLLHRPLDEVLASGKPDFPFCLCWANENWTRTWDGLDRHILIQQQYNEADDRAHIQWLADAFRDKRYIRIEGKPLFLVYRASNIPQPLHTTSVWREEARKIGVGEIFLCRVESFSEERDDPSHAGFDAAVEFQPDWTNLPNFMGYKLFGGKVQKPLSKIRPLKNILSRLDQGRTKVADYATLVRIALEQAPSPYLRFPCVTPSFDNTPRRKKGPAIIRGASPELYRQWLSSVLKKFVPRSKETNLVFINAGNEWAEGNHLEPDVKWGRAFLEATRDTLNSVD